MSSEATQNPDKAARKHEFVWDGRDERDEDARLSTIAGRAATDLKLKEFDLRLLLHLGRFNHKKGWCRLNQTQLAQLLGVGRQFASQRIKLLVKWKYIEKKEQKKTRESFCFYRVIIDEPRSCGDASEGVSSGDDTPGGVSPHGDTPEDGGVSSGDDTGGVSSHGDTSVATRDDTPVATSDDTPHSIPRARVDMSVMSKREERKLTCARATDLDLGAAVTAARQAKAQAESTRAADEIAAGTRLPFSADVIRELTALDIDVTELVERYFRRTKRRAITDPSAYLLGMGRDQVAKRLGITVEAVKAMASGKLAKPAAAAVRAAGEVTGPSRVAVERAQRLRPTLVQPALAMIAGRRFASLIQADRAFELALANVRFSASPPPAASHTQQGATQ